MRRVLITSAIVFSLSVLAAATEPEQVASYIVAPVQGGIMCVKASAPRGQLAFVHHLVDGNLVYTSNDREERRSSNDEDTVIEANHESVGMALVLDPKAIRKPESALQSESVRAVVAPEITSRQIYLTPSAGTLILNDTIGPDADIADEVTCVRKAVQR